MLEMKINDSPITEDEYLEDALKLIPGIRAWIGCGKLFGGWDQLCLVIQNLTCMFN